MLKESIKNIMAGKLFGKRYAREPSLGVFAVNDPL
jgi:hypothetical protein